MNWEQNQEETLQTIKILIVDDNAAFVQLLKNFLSSESDIEVVGEASDGETALGQAKKLQPDIVLMDVSMKEVNGISSARQIKRVMPEVEVIMLSVYDLDEYRLAAKATGACCYILKKNLIKELLPAIHSVFSKSNDGNLPKKTPDDKG